MGEAASPDASLRCHDLAVDYGSTRALDGVDLEVREGEIVALLGPSGSGKTTLLHAAAGFVAPARGTVCIAGREVSGPGWATPPERRSVGLVFQSYALWPHLTALETVAYPLERHGATRRTAHSRAAELLEKVGLGELAGRRPNQLSGGEQQRVGLARALAGEPALFLLDEPTANLDATIKPLLQHEIVEQQRSTGAGALYVTHDPAEAFAVAHRIAILERGRLLQVAQPVTIYMEPVSLAVAALTGPLSTVPVSNARFAGNGSIEFLLNGRPIMCSGALTGLGSAGTAILRPEWLRISAAGELPLAGMVAVIRYQGAFTDYLLKDHSLQVTVRRAGPPVYALGETLSWSPERAVIV